MKLLLESGIKSCECWAYARAAYIPGILGRGYVAVAYNAAELARASIVTACYHEETVPSDAGLE